MQLQSQVQLHHRRLETGRKSEVQAVESTFLCPGAAAHCGCSPGVAEGISSRCLGACMHGDAILGSLQSSHTMTREDFVNVEIPMRTGLRHSLDCLDWASAKSIVQFQLRPWGPASGREAGVSAILDAVCRTWFHQQPGFEWFCVAPACESHC